MPKDRHLNRRGFFGEFLGPWLRSSPRREECLLPTRPPRKRSLLRPPGALAESDLLQTCFHCGNCVDSCPAEAIQTYLGADETLIGTPFIDPDEQPCVVCNSLACMDVCPSGALQKLAREQIQMGRAEWSQEECVRTSGETCQTCVERCPFGHVAIQIGAERQIEVLPGCVGCGVCQHACPADAIHVLPTSV